MTIFEEKKSGTREMDARNCKSCSNAFEKVTLSS